MSVVLAVRDMCQARYCYFDCGTKSGMRSESYRVEPTRRELATLTDKDGILSSALSNGRRLYHRDPSKDASFMVDVHTCT